MNPPSVAQVRAGRRICGAVLSAAVLLAGCSSPGGDDVTESLETSSEGDERSQRVVAQLDEAGLTTIASAVRDAGLDEVVDAAEFTLFAPDDGAFQDLTADELADLTSEPEQMTEMLRDHVVERAISADELAGMSEVTTVGGTTLDVRTDDGTVTVGDASVVETVTPSGDVVVHVTDALLVRE